MQRSWAVPAVLVYGVVIVASAFGQEIHLKTRTFMAPAQSRNTEQRTSKRVHRIVAFDHPVGVDDLDMLANAGAQITGVLPDNAVVVSVPAGFRGRPRGSSWIGTMEAQDKISPALSQISQSVVVEFHSDIDASQQAALGATLGLVFVRPAGLLAAHVVVQADASAIGRLSQQDEVAYIFPADPGLLESGVIYPCGGMLTTAGQVAQYATVTHGWALDSDNAAHLSYSFGSLTAKVPAAAVQSEILRAFAQWTARLNVTFQPTSALSAGRSIFIQFVGGAHGDSYPFDGPSGMLAHTFYPAPVNFESIAGDMHFDADEPWRTGGDTDIYAVALHETGHALGLSHSDNPGDVMYPYYRRGMTLSANDIAAALELYPAAGAKAPQSTLPPLSLTITPPPTTTQVAVIGLSGVVSGGYGPESVQWQTNHGYTGVAAVSASGGWSTPVNIPLVAGLNVFTVTAFDAADQLTTRTASVTLLVPQPTVAGPITLSISSPASPVATVKTATMTVTGKASGGAGVAQVVWQTSNGATGTACGTGTWVASGIPLPQGTTTIILRAYDSKGASVWVAQVAVRP